MHEIVWKKSTGKINSTTNREEYEQVFSPKHLIREGLISADFVKYFEWFTKNCNGNKKVTPNVRCDFNDARWKSGHWVAIATFVDGEKFNKNPNRYRYDKMYGFHKGSWKTEFAKMLIDYNMEAKFVEEFTSKDGKCPIDIEKEREKLLKSGELKSSKKKSETAEVSVKDDTADKGLKELDNLGEAFEGVKLYADNSNKHLLSIYTSEGAKIAECELSEGGTVPSILDMVVSYIAQHPDVAENIPDRVLVNHPSLMTEVIDEMFLQICGGPELEKLQDKSIEELEAIKSKLISDKAIIVETEKRKMEAIEEEKARREAERKKKQSIFDDIRGLRKGSTSGGVENENNGKGQMGGE